VARRLPRRVLDRGDPGDPAFALIVFAVRERGVAAERSPKPVEVRFNRATMRGSARLLGRHRAGTALTLARFSEAFLILLFRRPGLRTALRAALWWA